MRRLAIFPSAILPILLAACATTTQSCELRNGITLDTYVVHHQPEILAGIDSVPASMIFDTGSNASSLSPQIAKAAGLGDVVSDRSVTASGVAGAAKVGFANVKQFMLGNAVADNAQFEIIDTPMTEADPAGNGADGLLGNDIIKNYDVDLDLPDHKITLYADAPCQVAVPPWPGPSTVTPVTVDYYGYILLPLSIDGHPMTALLDTGAGISFMPRELFNSSGLAASGPRLLGKARAAGVGGLIPVDVYQLNEMTVAGQTIKNPLFTVPPPLSRNIILIQKILKAREPAPTRFDFLQFRSTDDVILGESYLSQHRIFISHATKTIFVQQ